MITDNYIKMCGRAKEIQKVFEFNMGDWFLHTDYLKTEHLIVLDERIVSVAVINTYKEEGAIWLPTQEQLQGMMLKESNFYDNISNFYCFLCEEYTYFTMLSTTEEKLKHKNMNELWLVFVMKEKYNKTWTGEEWIP